MADKVKRVASPFSQFTEGQGFPSGLKAGILVRPVRAVREHEESFCSLFFRWDPCFSFPAWILSLSYRWYEKYPPPSEAPFKLSHSSSNIVEP